jgi:hypothetical protein
MLGCSEQEAAQGFASGGTCIITTTTRLFLLQSPYGVAHYGSHWLPFCWIEIDRDWASLFSISFLGCRCYLFEISELFYLTILATMYVPPYDSTGLGQILALCLWVLHTVQYTSDIRDHVSVEQCIGNTLNSCDAMVMDIQLEPALRCRHAYKYCGLPSHWGSSDLIGTEVQCD